MSNKDDTFNNHCNILENNALNLLIAQAKNQIPAIGVRNKYCDILEYIAKKPNVTLDAKQIAFLLRYESPALGQYRNDYFIVLDRVLKSAEATGELALVKEVYLKGIHFYKNHKDNEKKLAIIERGIAWFSDKNALHYVGELCLHLAWSQIGITKQRQYCEQALKYLNQSSKEYACALAMRKLLCHMGCYKNKDYFHYRVFGETIFRKEENLFLSPICTYFSFNKKAPSLYSNSSVPMVNVEYTESIFYYQNDDKPVIDESLIIGASNHSFKESELLHLPNEKVICQADGQEYVCRVFSKGPQNYNEETVQGEEHRKDYFAPGVGLVRTVLSVDDKKYIYELCEYSIKGGKGWLPLCVGNKWVYRQVGGPNSIEQIIEREIIGQNGEEYLISGWDYAGNKTDTLIE